MSKREDQTTPQESRIPEFKSYAEEAAFWDAHDFTEFEDETKPVKVRFAKNLSGALKVRFDPVTLAKLRERAAEQGIGPTTLVRMWVLDRLRSGENSRT